MSNTIQMRKTRRNTIFIAVWFLGFGFVLGAMTAKFYWYAGVEPTSDRILIQECPKPVDCVPVNDCLKAAIESPSLEEVHKEQEKVRRAQDEALGILRTARALHAECLKRFP